MRVSPIKTEIWEIANSKRQAECRYCGNVTPDQPSPYGVTLHKGCGRGIDRRVFCGTGGRFCSVGCQARGEHRDWALMNPWVAV